MLSYNFSICLPKNIAQNFYKVQMAYGFDFFLKNFWLFSEI